MPEWAVQRRFTRFPIVLPVLHRLKGPGTVRTGVGWTRDLSGGGACVQLAEQLPPQVPLNLRLQTDRGAIELEGEVAWVGDPPKAGGGILHGVAFTHIAPDQLQTLRELIISKGKVRNTGGVRLPLEISITCQRKGQAVTPLQGRTGNLSKGGLLLFLPQSYTPGTPLEVTLHSPAGPLTAEGVVVWNQPSVGRALGEPIPHGFRFTALGWSRALALGLMLAEAA
jgi:c-di-GMP-binding flagellar brake protein YcgR